MSAGGGGVSDADGTADMLLEEPTKELNTGSAYRMDSDNKNPSEITDESNYSQALIRNPVHHLFRRPLTIQSSLVCSLKVNHSRIVSLENFTQLSCCY
ncbi:unnamed protein product [Ceratitis capitata]|uniref:(Mediterranean fruit fly) hypothetical protein n=1 Tax=Ceratitis capitata TaxID=7213 RepID=A0A811UV05_CERCA|nr:unnamed protein product [Ceratitis capitata]